MSIFDPTKTHSEKSGNIGLDLYGYLTFDMFYFVICVRICDLSAPQNLNLTRYSINK